MSRVDIPARCCGTILGIVSCPAAVAAQADVLRTWVAPPGTTLDHEPIYTPYYTYVGRTTLSAIPDLDGDGVPELLVGDSDFVGPGGERGALFVLSSLPPGPGEPAAILRTHLGVRPSTSLYSTTPGSMGDVDGDKVPDYTNGTFILSGRDGSAVFSGSIHPLADLDGDGLAEFVDGDRVRSGGSLEVRYRLQHRPSSVADLGDVNREGVQDFFFQEFFPGNEYGEGAGLSFGVFSGENGRMLWTNGISYYPPPFSSPGDLNGDGIGDLLGDGVFDGATGDRFAQTPRPESEVQASLGWISAAPGDLDGDGVIDLWAERFESDGERSESSLVAIDGRRLRPLWESGLEEYSLPSATGIDWNDDGFPDFLRGEELDEETWVITLHSGAPARGRNGSPRAGVRAAGSPCSPRLARAPRIGISGTPWIGEELELHLSGVAPGTGAFLLLGDLVPGGGGRACQPSVLAREVRIVKALEIRPGHGLATSVLAVPPDLALVGGILHAQWLVGSLAKPHAITRTLELEFGIGPRFPATASGRVVLEDGTPVADATIELLGQELLATTAADGRFVVENVPYRFSGLHVFALAEIDGERWSGIAEPVAAAPGSTTELGDVVLSRARKVLALPPYPKFYGPSPLRDPLLQLGMARENLLELQTLPLSLSAFDAIWHVADEAPTVAEQVRLAEYVQAGGSLLVNGFHTELLNRVLLQDAPTVTTFHGGYPFHFSEPGPDGISILPNALTSLLFQSGPQAVFGVADRNVLVRSEQGYAVGAAWSRSELVGGLGHLVAIAGDSWIYQRYSRNPLEVYENLHTYLLQGPPAAVTGTVRFSTGSPVAHADVRLAPFGIETRADRSGTFLFPDVTSRLTAGELEGSTIRKTGTYRGTATVTRAPGTLAHVDIVLRRASLDILLFGDFLGGRHMLARQLDSILPSETRIDSEAELPTDVGHYGTIWHVGRAVALSPEVRARLADYVRSGGALHLSGETLTRDERLTDSILALLGLLIPDRAWTVDPRNAPEPHRFEPSVCRSATRLPNHITDWSPGGAARIFGLRASEVLVRDGSGAPCGALWDERDLGGRGRVSLLMDSGWLLTTVPSRRATIENLQRFLSPSAGQLPGR